MGYWTGKCIFVTGCNGFLGGWLTHRLVEEGAEVVGLVWEEIPDANFYRLGLNKRINCAPGDIRDLDTLVKVLREYHIDTVFHLAAQSLVTKANVSPLETWETNSRGTWLLLEAVRQTASIRRVVVASSDKVYGDQTTLPYTESTPLSAINPYDVSKACADLVSQSYARSFALPIGIIRCGNIYGGGDMNFDRLIPGTIMALLRDEQPVIRSDGNFTRDYLYVADVVEAYLALGSCLDNTKFHGQAFNYGNEQPLTVLDVVEAIARIMERTDLTPIIQNTATNEIRHQSLSPAKFTDLIGCHPTYSLDEGLRETISWYKESLVDGPNR